MGRINGGRDFESRDLSRDSAERTSGLGPPKPRMRPSRESVAPGPRLVQERSAALAPPRPCAPSSGQRNAAAASPDPAGIAGCCAGLTRAPLRAAMRPNGRGSRGSCAGLEPPCSAAQVRAGQGGGMPDARERPKFDMRRGLLDAPARRAGCDAPGGAREPPPSSGGLSAGPPHSASALRAAVGACGRSAPPPIPPAGFTAATRPAGKPPHRHVVAFTAAVTSALRAAADAPLDGASLALASLSPGRPMWPRTFCFVGGSLPPAEQAHTQVPRRHPVSY